MAKGLTECEGGSRFPGLTRQTAIQFD